MYKPNFCAECGARVERERWRVWTSGRFCSACDWRFRRRRLLLPLALAASLLSVGFVAGRALRATPAPSHPLVVRRVEDEHAQEARDKDEEDDGRADDGGKVGAGERGGARTGAALYGADGTESERPTDPAEVVSICGARTKKGTACSRRVRGMGRCWQHRGMPAILPQSKLVVPN